MTDQFTVSKKKHWTQDEMGRPAGFATFMGWKRLAALLKATGELRSVEEITAFTINNNGLDIHLEIKDIPESGC